MGNVPRRGPVQGQRRRITMQVWKWFPIRFTEPRAPQSQIAFDHRSAQLNVINERSKSKPFPACDTQQSSRRHHG